MSKNLYPSVDDDFFESKNTDKEEIETFNIYQKLNQELDNFENPDPKNNKNSDTLENPDAHENPDTTDIRILVKTHQDTSFGLGLNNVDGIWLVSQIEVNSPASYAQINFGDQIVSVNGDPLSHKTYDQVRILFMNLSSDVDLHIRTRPMCQTYHIIKSDGNKCGFTFLNGSIVHITPDSPAHYSGMPTNHQIIAINQQDVLGWTDIQIIKFIEKLPPQINITLMANNQFRQMTPIET